MSEEFWRNKLAQTFHDPFVKAFCQGAMTRSITRDLLRTDFGNENIPEELRDLRSQHQLAALLSARLFGEAVWLDRRRKERLNEAFARRGQELADALNAGVLPAELAPDHAATGADRPNLGGYWQVRVQLWKRDQERFVVAHPLADFRLPVPAPATTSDLLDKLRPAIVHLDVYRDELRGKSGEERYRFAWYQMWRRLPEELAADDGVFWPLQPADTRCPDHSIWDHLRVASSLAFLPYSARADGVLQGEEAQRRAWLLSLWIGPADAFLGAARTGRDLWTGSLMLSELAFAMIEPIIEELGPDSILYPDLRANTRADLWLANNIEGLIEKPPGTRASLIPNRLVAVVPEGHLDALATACLKRAQERWKRMTVAVRNELSEQVGTGSWTEIFDRQIAQTPAMHWCAVRWAWDGKPDPAFKCADIKLDPALPFQTNPKRLPAEIRAIEDKRAKRFAGWIDTDVCNHYEGLRQTSLMTHPGYTLNQRGFDYPLIHHQLLMLDDARRRAGHPANPEEPGEKCTLCGARQALSNRPDGTVGQQRNAASEFWEDLGDEGDGAERLCGPCSVRRFLTNTDDPIKQIWEDTLSDDEKNSGGQNNVPFPSTGLIAGQVWLEKLCNKYREGDISTHSAVADVVQKFGIVRALGDTRIVPKTQFVSSVPRLRRLRKRFDATLEEFLRCDIQALAPQWWDHPERAALSGADKAKQACEALRRSLGNPKTDIAVVTLDGDQMGRLLLGVPDRVKARWRDVLHPDAVEQILRDGGSSTETRWKAHWRATLDRARVMGPSTHAFVTRALRHFSNRLLPWVVERAYGGQLIYAGGDEALFLCPAADALPMLDCLSALFSASWVLDKSPDATAWPRDERPNDKLYDIASKEARERFSTTFDLLDVSGARIVPMLGRHQSLSAGIAFGPYKTPLRRLRREAQTALDTAKKAGGRSAGLAWFTGNGLKVSWTAPLDAKKPGSTNAIRKLACRFKKKTLPSRLPYKLRELLPMARAIQGHEPPLQEAGRLLEGLLRDALDGGMDETAFAMWCAGLEGGEGERSLDGLLLARALKDHAEDKEPQ